VFVVCPVIGVPPVNHWKVVPGTPAGTDKVTLTPVQNVVGPVVETVPEGEGLTFILNVTKQVERVLV